MPNAPDHRGETERWTLHVARRGLMVFPGRLCGFGSHCDLPEAEHIEVVPATALAAAQHELNVKNEAFEAASECGLQWAQRAEEAQKALIEMDGEVIRLGDELEEAQKEVERLRASEVGNATLTRVRVLEESLESERIARCKDQQKLEGAEALAARMREVFSWLLGENAEFPIRETGQGAYYWRTELRKRMAALDGK